MNYFAHGFQYVDRPYFLAGTAVPDWLSVLNRKSRAHERLARPWTDSDDPIVAEVARGVCQHHEDDDWFHRHPDFQILQAQVSALLRTRLPGDRGFRTSFVAHVSIEMLLDAFLIERTSDLIERYYEALLGLDAGRVQEAVNQMTTQPIVGLPLLIPDFCGERFLNDYGEDATLLRRLNNVMRRVKLPVLPAEVIEDIAAVRAQVEDVAPKLLDRLSWS